MTAIGERAGAGTIRGLLEQGAYVEQIDERGFWPLVLAAENVQRWCGRFWMAGRT
jgi:hypothetical protein